MSDFEHKLARILQDAGESFEPSDEAEARRRFLERARRRRWYGFAQVAAVAGIGIAAFLFFTYNSRTEEKVHPEEEVAAGAPEIVATIEVDGEPVSIDGATGTHVWVAGGDRLVSIDPETQETGTVSLDTPPAEVAVGEDSLWVATDGPDGAVTMADPDTGELSPTQLLADGEATWDLAIDGSLLWAVDGHTGNIYTGAADGASRSSFPGKVFTDIAVDQKGVWALDQDAGLLFHLDQSMNLIGGPIEVPTGENADLIAGFQYVYLSPGNGTLYQITPPGTTDMVERELGDSYMDLTVHEKSVWALVNIDEKHKNLFEINPATMEVIGEPLPIEGDANDVVAEAGSVWVADGRGEVLRIEPSRDVDDPPPPSEDDQSNVEPSPAPPTDEQILFVYSANGDLFAETLHGDVVPLTSTPEIEQHPAFAPDGKSIVFERDPRSELQHGPGPGPDPDIIQLDLATGEEEWLGDGSWPALAPDGRLASVTSSTEVNESSADGIFIRDDPSDPKSGGMNVVGTPELPNISHLTWTPDGVGLIFQASGERVVIKRTDVDGLELSGVATQLSPELSAGQIFVSPQTTSSNWVNVLQVCCSPTEGDPYEALDAGRIQLEEGAASFDGEVQIDIPSLQPTIEIESMSGGSLALSPEEQPDARWTTDASAPSYFISDGHTLWLVSEDDATLIGGSADPLSGHEGETDFRGLAVHPSLLD